MNASQIGHRILQITELLLLSDDFLTAHDEMFLMRHKKPQMIARNA
ncbi:hypothetical protein BJ928_12283 [Rhizobium sp. WW_1]|nr:hypothetical protein BJ928_12283 [Rhizobium sp. WW_1]